MELPLYEKIYRNLLSQIETGHLRPSDRVPTEKELADQFQVSRITTKKALEKLVQLGVIHRIRGKGSYVVEKLPDFSSIHSSDNLVKEVNHQEANGIIGLIIPDFFSDFFGRRLLRSLEKCCSDMKLNLLIKLTYGNQEEEDEAINTLIQHKVKGIIIYPVNDQHYTASLLRLVVEKFPLVLIDRYLKGIPACAVYTDNKSAAQKLTDSLLTKGHKNIAFISPPEEFTSSIEERIIGFLAAYSQKDIGVNPKHILTDIFHTLPTFNQTDEFFEDQLKLRTFIEENPQVTAFICCEYEIACVLTQVIKALGKDIPKDYAIACFDHPRWLYNDLVFTHIQQNEELIGKKAVELLLKQIHGESVPLQNMVDFKLIEGTSI